MLEGLGLTGLVRAEAMNVEELISLTAALKARLGDDKDTRLHRYGHRHGRRGRVSAGPASRPVNERGSAGTGAASVIRSRAGKIIPSSIPVGAGTIIPSSIPAGATTTKRSAGVGKDGRPGGNTRNGPRPGTTCARYGRARGGAGPPMTVPPRASDIVRRPSLRSREVTCVLAGFIDVPPNDLIGTRGTIPPGTLPLE